MGKANIYNLNKTEWILISFPETAKAREASFRALESEKNQEFCLNKLSLNKYYEYKER